ncbi:hypothetical protein [Planomonospora venezuelensis]|uniref:Homeodomain-like domain-containing protein n=1 Tax=Planomonospora venezuelensis TaxID=1999 RepID=A0A841D4A1_PLAVE|nr:hypothetical protein [Planomonospora venezuelensis]MBB5965081.1 hypothetical protein [Planomonospora venezuelensis]GIN05001.1 hypothetical protein Pve01_66590 [Planomonospora venezuelensis]
MGSRRITCACCGRPGDHDTNGWVKSCAVRWRAAGRPADGPPAPGVRGTGGEWQAARERRAEYAELAGLGWSKTYIAWELSVSVRTVERYAAAAKEMTCG